jgi:hypothetical protein
MSIEGKKAPPFCGTALYGLNANSNILATRGDGKNNHGILFSSLRYDGEIRPIFVLTNNHKRISYVLWHPSNPMIFFTIDEKEVNAHQLFENFDTEEEHNSGSNEKTSFLLGTLECKYEVSSISITENGLMMSVVFFESNFTKLLRLDYSQSSIKFSNIRNIGIRERYPIIQSKFLGNSIIGIISGYDEGSVNILCIDSVDGKKNQECFNDEDLYNFIDCNFSPDNKFFVVLSIENLTIFQFSEHSFCLSIPRTIEFHPNYFGVSFRWSPIFAVLIILCRDLDRNSHILFYHVTESAVELIYEYFISGAHLDDSFLVDSKSVMFGYKNLDDITMFLRINFEDIKIPVEKLLLLRNGLNKHLPADIGRRILYEVFESHPSLKRMMRHM